MPVRRAPLGFGEFQLQEFEKGHKIREHFHAHPYLSFVGAGGYLEKSAICENFYQKNQIIFHPENESHQNAFVEPSSVFSLFLNAGLEDGLKRRIRLVKGGIYNLPNLQLLFKKISYEFRVRDQFSPLVMEGLGYEILGEFLRALKGSNQAGYKHIASQTIEILNETPERDLTLSEISTLLGVEPSTVARSFKKLTGVTLSEYQRGRRVEAAKDYLVKTSLPLSQIALEAGFYDQSHMCRVFRKFTGLSPLKFRQKFCS